ncbi:hypothetical protein KIN20_008993 [Parelaphostrongylus tenuis]|uniref:Uncharacterized protein n=1 Tax=Parelaphostrongylus tenuis TaxID=148309 RepID=A0AAD5QK96_PARTN|nr:hypothetical protein KIN20_008993 [Parelaphostrongylus tenuis]
MDVAQRVLSCSPPLKAESRDLPFRKIYTVKNEVAQQRSSKVPPTCEKKRKSDERPKRTIHRQEDETPQIAAQNQQPRLEAQSTKKIRPIGFAEGKEFRYAFESSALKKTKCVELLIK